jgi:hypothetical protein
MRDQELRLALHRQFGDVIKVQELPPLGLGSDYPFGGSDGSELLQLLGTESWMRWERFVLSGGNQSWREPKRGWFEEADRYIENRSNVVKYFQSMKATQDERREVMRVAEAQQLLELAYPVLVEAGVPLAEIDVKVDENWILGLKDELPLIRCLHDLALVLYGNSTLPLKQSDFADMAFLPQAIVCCDYVVTERHWVDIAKRAGVDRTFRTTLLSSVKDLEGVLSRSVAN